MINSAFRRLRKHSLRRPVALFVVALVVVKGSIGQAQSAEQFEERLPVFGVIKPGSITTLLAVNHGIVSQVHKGIGDSVASQTPILEVMERESQRTYRTALAGKVAKLHVTSGAAVTPGMPLITILDPQSKLIEVSLSASEARGVSVGSVVTERATGLRFGKVSKVSPLVDPDSGAVMSYVQPDKAINQLIGDVVPLGIIVRRIEGCRVVELAELAKQSPDESVEAIAGSKVCLKRKPAGSSVAH